MFAYGFAMRPAVGAERLGVAAVESAVPQAGGSDRAVAHAVPDPGVRLSPDDRQLPISLRAAAPAGAAAMPVGLLLVVLGRRRDRLLD